MYFVVFSLVLIPETSAKPLEAPRAKVKFWSMELFGGQTKVPELNFNLKMSFKILVCHWVPFEKKSKF